MNVELLQKNEVEKQIRDMLLSDWILVAGRNDLIERFENEIYTPGSSANRDFALFTGVDFFYDGKFGYLYLARKTFRLFKFLGLARGTFDSLLGIELFDLIDSQCALKVLGLKAGVDKEQAISDLIVRMFQRKRES
jgi:hypothetical protein